MNTPGNPLQSIQTFIPSWRFDEPFIEPFDQDGFHGYLVGLVGTRTSDGIEVTGSSVRPLLEDAIARALSELLERIAACPDQLQQPNAQCRLSISNGWACHPNPDQAITNATWELLERDRILRHWYTGRKPKKLNQECLPHWSLDFHSGLQDRIQIYSLDDSRNPLEVCLATIETSNSNAPLLIPGYGSSLSFEGAIDAATKEALQRWAFLNQETPTAWNESLETASPDFHQDFYLSEQGQKQFRSWLAGDLSLGLKIPYPSPQLEDCVISSLVSIANRTVAQAKNPHAIPLVFGPDPRPLLPWLPERSPRWWHPIP